MSDLEQVAAYTVYRWDCDCGYVNYLEHDPAGEIVTCEDCGNESEVWETK